MELPRLETLWQTYREKGLSVVAVEAAGDRDRARKFITEKNLTFHLLENDKKEDVVGEKFKVDSFPTSLLIDRDGRIMYYHVGFRLGDETELEREIKELGLR